MRLFELFRAANRFLNVGKQFEEPKSLFVAWHVFSAKLTKFRSADIRVLILIVH